jgi:ABC-2 type transport system permease protein
MIQLTLFGALVPFLVGIPEETHITPASVAMSLVCLVMANLLHYLLLLPIQQVAFWAESVWSLVVAERFVMSLLGGMLLPLELFPSWAREILYWLPFPYLYAAPVRALMGKVTVTEWAWGLVIAGVWCIVAGYLGRMVWRRGDLQYTGVGL